MCKILQQEYNCTVRSEVATLIAIIYEEHNLTPDVLVKFYDIMSYTIDKDSNPIVRKNCLQFWKNVIQRHLTMKGMIDGAFPEVTFSKEARKIVVLTDDEIKRRLAKVLHELSQNGCLSALTKFTEDCVTEVVTTANKILNEFYDLLKQYNMNILDLESHNTIHLEDKLFELPKLMETNECILNGRQMLRPDLFFEYAQNFNNHSFERPHNILLETILNEIICQNSSKIYTQPVSDR